MTIGVYRITNKANNKFYIGSSKHCEKRFIQHKYHLRRGSHHCNFLQSSWTKYGAENFVFEIISNFSNMDEALSEEQVLLSKYYGGGDCMNTSGYAVLPLLHKNCREKAKIAIQKSEKYKEVHREVCLKRNADPEFRNRLKESLANSEKHKISSVRNAHTTLKRPDVVEKNRESLRNSQKQKDAARKQALFLCNDPEIRAKNLLATSVKVVGTNIKTGEKVYFRSQSEAARAVKCSPSNISMCCLGTMKHAKGYTWEREITALCPTQE